MIDLTDPNAADVREVLHSHAPDVGEPRLDLATRAERRALSLRRQRAAALSGGVAVVLAAAVAIPLSLSGRGAGARIEPNPPTSSTGTIRSTTIPIVDTDPTTWPFRGNARISQALEDAAITEFTLRTDRTTDWKVQPLYAGQVDLTGDRFLVFLAIPTDPAKSIAVGLWQQPTSGTGFLIQPYDIGAAGQLDARVLAMSPSTGSIKWVAIVGAPDAVSYRIVTSLGGGRTHDEPCPSTDGVTLCAGGDVTTDVVQQLNSAGQVVGTSRVHSGSLD